MRVLGTSTDVHHHLHRRSKHLNYDRNLWTFPRSVVKVCMNLENVCTMHLLKKSLSQKPDLSTNPIDTPASRVLHIPLSVICAACPWKKEEWPQCCRKVYLTKHEMVQDGPDRQFGQNRLILNQILALARPIWKTKRSRFRSEEFTRRHYRTDTNPKANPCALCYRLIVGSQGGHKVKLGCYLREPPLPQPDPIG